VTMSDIHPLRGPAPPLTIELDPSLVLAYRKEAIKRDMPVKRLVCNLLDRIVADQLTGAILDHDGDPGD
jgi:hypothetical protein